MTKEKKTAKMVLYMFRFEFRKRSVEMKRYIREILVLLVQLLMFYVFPLAAGPTDIMGMVVIILGATFILSMILGIISGKKIKFFYPVFVALSFIPSVFIYYNDTALVQALWYFVISMAALLIGSAIHRFYYRKW